ncbi:MAG: hypothetical protein AAF466_09130 [Bacteroidota bacterium]
MKSIANLQRNLATLVLLFCGLVLSAQSSSKESFNVGNDVLVSVNTSHTNVVFETWNKDKVEVEAFIDDESLSEAEKKKIFDNWDLDVLGNSKKVVITSNEGSLWGGIESMGSLKALSRLGELESLKGLDALKELKNMPIIADLGNMNWNIEVPEVPELGNFPVWPFNSERPNFKDGDEYNYYNDNNNRSYTFDRSKYKKNKQAYVDKLNGKYNTNVSVREVDSWLSDVDEWGENVEKVMEEWGEEFGKNFQMNFGPDFEIRMEKWGEEFGKEMEKWGEEFGEKFGKEMEKWGEEFGKDMEKWGEEFGKSMEEWAKQFEENGHNYSHKVTTDENGNKSYIIQSDGGLFKESNVKAKKTIIIRLPKGAKTDINVRHGEVKMADAYNLKANLNYAKLTANSVDGGETLINAAYAPVYVNYWGKGALDLQFVDDCKLNNVERIHVEANSSNVNINKLNDEALLSGSFGSLFINEISDRFGSIDIVLENTDATLSFPDTSFNFYYNGKKSRFKVPSELEITTNTKNDSRSLLKGFHGSKGSNRSLTINASYSNVSFQN